MDRLFKKLGFLRRNIFLYSRDVLIYRKTDHLQFFTEHPIFTKTIKSLTIYIQVCGYNFIFSFPYGSEILPNLPSKGKGFEIIFFYVFL